MRFPYLYATPFFHLCYILQSTLKTASFSTTLNHCGFLFFVSVLPEASNDAHQIDCYGGLANEKLWRDALTQTLSGGNRSADKRYMMGLLTWFLPPAILCLLTVVRFTLRTHVGVWPEIEHSLIEHNIPPLLVTSPK